MYENTQKKIKMQHCSTQLQMYFLSFYIDLLTGKNQYNDLGSTITTFLLHTLLLQCHNNIKL